MHALSLQPKVIAPQRFDFWDHACRKYAIAKFSSAHVVRYTATITPSSPMSDDIALTLAFDPGHPGRVLHAQLNRSATRDCVSFMSLYTLTKFILEHHRHASPAADSVISAILRKQTQRG